MSSNNHPHNCEVVAPKKFGTDIHRHTVEFSKNTHTPSLTNLAFARSRVTCSSPPSLSASGADTNLTRRFVSGEIIQAPSSNLVVPYLPVRVGVRVALTWNKLRDAHTEHQIARSTAVSGRFRRREAVHGTQYLTASCWTTSSSSDA